MALKTLSRRHQDIQVGDRQFRLNEFTLDQLHHFLDGYQAIAPKAVQALGDDPLSNYPAALDVATMESEQLVLWILREPIDGGPPPDSAWYRANVTAPMQRDIVQEVYDLNQIEKLLGEVMSLLEVVRERAQQTPTGSSSSTP